MKFGMLIGTSFAIGISALFAGCGGSGGVQLGASSEQYSYDFEVNGCKTGKHSFDSKDALCKGLQDEGLNNSCAWSTRSDYYAKNCSDGKPMPQPQAPAQAAQPVPQSNPPEVVSPKQNPRNPKRPRPETPREWHHYPAIQTLENAGITVKVESDRIDLPGRPTFEQRLLKFQDALAAVAPDLAARKDLYQTIMLADWASYSQGSRMLYLSINLSESELRAYLDLNDRRLTWQAQTGISLEMGIDLFGDEKNGTKELKEKIEFLEQNAAEFKELSVLVKKIKATSVSYPRFSLTDQIFEMPLDKFQAYLGDFLLKSRDAVSFFGWGASQKISISGNLEYFPDPEYFNSFMKQALDSTADLETLKKLGGLSEIEFSRNHSGMFYDQRRKKLSLATSDEAARLNRELIEAMAYKYRLSTQLGVEISSDGMTFLDRKFLKAISSLQANEELLLQKKASIKRIQLTYETGYRQGFLSVGYESNDNALRALLLKLPN